MNDHIKKSLMTLFLILVALFFASSLIRSIATYRDKMDFYRTLEAERDKEKTINKKLKSNVRKSHDYYYVERNIREKLNLLKEDEISVILPPLSPTPIPTALPTKTPLQEWKELAIPHIFQ